MNDDDFDDIEHRIRELRTQYPNSRESRQLHERLVRFKQDPTYDARFRKAMSFLTKWGFRTGRRADT